MINSFQQTIDRSTQIDCKVFSKSIQKSGSPRDAARTGLIDLAPNVAVFYTRQ